MPVPGNISVSLEQLEQPAREFFPSAAWRLVLGNAGSQQECAARLLKLARKEPGAGRNNLVLDPDAKRVAQDLVLSVRPLLKQVAAEEQDKLLKPASEAWRAFRRIDWAGAKIELLPPQLWRDFLASDASRTQLSIDFRPAARKSRAPPAQSRSPKRPGWRR